MIVIYGEGNFLKAFDKAYREALRRGKESCIYQYVEEPWGTELRVVGRTMHPSFMGGPVPKWDPKRDQFSRMLRQAV